MVSLLLHYFLILFQDLAIISLIILIITLSMCRSLLKHSSDIISLTIVRHWAWRKILVIRIWLATLLQIRLISIQDLSKTDVIIILMIKLLRESIWIITHWWLDTILIILVMIICSRFIQILLWEWNLLVLDLILFLLVLIIIGMHSLCGLLWNIAEWLWNSRSMLLFKRAAARLILGDYTWD